jgi:CDP-diacylglycerol---glycerol-3-phosphate 3-phosphatidyltransferase
MFEYQRPDWTFHGKGVWYYLPGDRLPVATLIGSPNFGHRSVEKDLEAQITIVTKNETLRKNLDNEQKGLFDKSDIVNAETYEKPERRVPNWVKCVVFVARNFF